MIPRPIAARVVGLGLLALGAGALLETIRIKDEWTGARLMPLVAAVALLLLGIAHFVMTPPVLTTSEPGDRPARGRVALVLGVLVGYVALFPTLGFLITTLALLLVLIAVLGTYRWPVTVGLALGLGLACHVVFRTWLGMPLPDGLFGY